MLWSLDELTVESALIAATLGHRLWSSQFGLARSGPGSASGRFDRRLGLRDPVVRRPGAGGNTVATT